jgi:hypothetical protein
MGRQFEQSGKGGPWTLIDYVGTQMDDEVKIASKYPNSTAALEAVAEG